MADFLTLYAQLQPDKLAVVDDRPTGDVIELDFAELEQRSNRLANVLVDFGVVPGETKVVWCGQNSIGLVTMINAARKLGLTAVPLNYRLSDEEAAYVTDHCDARIVYVDAEYADTFQRIREHIPQVEKILVFDGAAPEPFLSADALMSEASTDEPVVPDATEAGATMIYTSGTTGKP